MKGVGGNLEAASARGRFDTSKDTEKRTMDHEQLIGYFDDKGEVRRILWMKL